MMKRLMVLAMMLLVMCACCLQFPVSAASETYSIPEMDIKVSIGSDYIVLLRSDPSSKTDPVTSALFEGNKAQLYALSTDATHIVQITPETSTQNVDEMDTTTLNYFVYGLAYGYELKGYTISQKGIFRNSQATFAKILCIDPATKNNILLYYTAMNSCGISVTAQTEGKAFTKEQIASVETVVSGIQFGEKYHKSTADNTTQTNKTSDYVSNFTDRLNTSVKTHQNVVQTNRSLRSGGIMTKVIAAAILSAIYALFRWIKRKVVGTANSEPVSYEDAAVWECELCGMKNEKHHKKCQNCGTERYPGSSGGTRPVVSGETGTWQCANCGTENKNNYSQCKKCGKYRSQS